eukprot:CAMPEP_0198729764 /NCGR_PEP_ID=MMETSP1475-20131203/20891_1 /TAXON_ID= ORGANISM="Unidentified sp., Strain CCMP1999" /NCGR_SAMPLE_ID=MMETSP1475 /ASSEMBLY_ACC=CAM_ASM_001111 /LENGTH=748 /DNA_ID=CAMNT_0044492467 /DNA_START=192 /DNA_END=2438 /DNA_ORIENTATION=+
MRKESSLSMLNMQKFSRNPRRGDLEKPRNASVVVLGSGLAGLSAALSAVRFGAKTVTVVDKNAFLGGNSAKATSGINSVNLDDADSADQFAADTIAAGHEINDRDLVSLVAHESEGALTWLKSTFGLELVDVTRLGGHKHQRTWRFKPLADGRPRPVGWTIISTLKDRLESLASDGNVTVVKNAYAEKLTLNEEGAVNGVDVRVQDKTEHLSADAVVLATGGYSASRKLLEEHAPQFAKLPTTNGPWATGDGLQLAKSVGANLRDMEHVQVHPTSFLNLKDPTATTNFLAPEALRGCGGILVDDKGKRFVNELGPRDYVTNTILEKGFSIADYVSKGPKIVGSDGSKVDVKFDDGEGRVDRRGAFLILSSAMINKFGRGSAEFYRSKSLIFTFKNTEATESALGFPRDRLRNELESYALLSKHEKHDPFGKEHFPLGDTFSHAGGEELWVAAITPALHYSMGGLSISPSAEVFHLEPTGDLKRIPGLFAAGEVTGGMHGANRLAGNSLLECVVMGRIAGERAASVGLDKEALPLLHDAWTPCHVRAVHDTESDRYKVAILELPSVNHKLSLRRGQRIMLRSEEHAPVLVPTVKGEVTEGAVSVVVSSTLPGVHAGSRVDILGPIDVGDVDFEDVLDSADSVAVVATGDFVADILPLDQDKQTDVEVIAIDKAFTGSTGMLDTARVRINHAMDKEQAIGLLRGADEFSAVIIAVDSGEDDFREAAKADKVFTYKPRLGTSCPLSAKSDL